MREVIRGATVRRMPFLLAGAVFAAVGLGMIAKGLTGPGTVPLVLGGILVLLGGRPAAEGEERLVLDDHGLTDLKLQVGPVPWTEIRGATVVPLGTHFTMIALDLTDPARYAEVKTLDAGRLRELAAKLDFTLPEVFLYGSGLAQSPQEVVEEINRRARAPR